LLREDRAIVTDIPGTTRDVIEEAVDLAGVMVRLVDTAGIRETVDPLEQEGIRRTRSAQEDADLRLVVIDGSMALKQEDRDLVKSVMEGNHLVVINKCDLPSQVNKDTGGLGSNLFFVSAKTGIGLDQVRDAIRAALVSSGGDPSDGVLVTNVRHRTALRRATESLQQGLESSRRGLAGELISVDLRAAADALGEITGAITTDEILERIFSQFCIGK
jgi:tRNA modification GTPase